MDHVQSALQELYSSTDNHVKQQANNWLQKFQGTVSTHHN